MCGLPGAMSCVSDILCVLVALGVYESGSWNGPKYWAALTWFSSQPLVHVVSGRSFTCLSLCSPVE